MAEISCGATETHTHTHKTHRQTRTATQIGQRRTPQTHTQMDAHTHKHVCLFVRLAKLGIHCTHAAAWNTLKAGEQHSAPPVNLSALRKRQGTFLLEY